MTDEIPEGQFNLDDIEKQDHSFTRQEGNYLICQIPGHHHGVNIGPGKELIKNDKGEFELITHKV